MRRWDAPWLRPLLDVRRATTRAACAGLGVPVWDDPHNLDPRFTRVRLRHEVLPLLEDVLAGGVAEALARTAAQLREDADALDAVAARLLADARRPPADEEEVGAAPDTAPSDTASNVAPPDPTAPNVAALNAAALNVAPPDPAAPDVAALHVAALDTAALEDAPPALRRRVLRAWLAGAGVTGLTDAHLRAADVLAARGPDRGGVAVPGGLELFRAHGRLGIRPVRWPSARRGQC